MTEREPITEEWDGNTPIADLDREVALRKKNHAISCTYEKRGNKYIMTTVWSAFGKKKPS